MGLPNRSLMYVDGYALRKIVVSTAGTEASVLASPTVTSGSGAASGTPADGSMWLRTDGSPEFGVSSAWSTMALAGDSVAPAAAAPATATAIPVGVSASYPITTAAAETNTMAIPTSAGLVVSLICDVYAVGDRVITVAGGVNQTGNNTLTFGAAADHIVLISAQVAGALVWRVLANDGVGLSTV